MSAQTEEDNTAQNSPVAWFVVLERARLGNDFDVAARAKRELERLGVIIKYRKARSRGSDNEQG